MRDLIRSLEICSGTIVKLSHIGVADPAQFS
jgi:hypothetical protein